MLESEKIYRKGIREIMKYKAWMISEELGLIKGLEKYKIDNEELDDSYVRLGDLMLNVSDDIIDYASKFDISALKDTIDMSREFIAKNKILFTELEISLNFLDKNIKELKEYLDCIIGMRLSEKSLVKVMKRINRYTSYLRIVIDIGQPGNDAEELYITIISIRSELVSFMKDLMI